MHKVSVYIKGSNMGRIADILKKELNKESIGEVFQHVSGPVSVFVAENEYFLTGEMLWMVIVNILREDEVCVHIACGGGVEGLARIDSGESAVIRNLVNLLERICEQNEWQLKFNDDRDYHFTVT